MTDEANVGADGRLIEAMGERILRFERRYAHPVDEVWDAITDPDRSERWMFRTTFEPRVGGTVTTDLGDLGTVHGRVLDWEAPNRLEYEWTELADGSKEPETWRISFVLREVDGGTHLTFDHYLPEPQRPEFAAGWHWYLDRLASLLAGSPPAGVLTDADFDRLLAHYSS